MSVRSDSARIAELVRVVEALAAGQKQTLGDIARRVFGWNPQRVFDAIQEGVRSGTIAKGGARIPPVVRALERPASLEAAIASEPRR